MAILDALKAVALPAVEVHLSDVKSRDDFRQVSYVRLACEKTIMGLGFQGYAEAVSYTHLSFSPAIHRKLAGYDYQLVEKLSLIHISPGVKPVRCVRSGDGRRLSACLLYTSRCV